MLYGLIGEKLGHSYSKEIHGKIADYGYQLKEIPKEELACFMQARDFKGINVTIPYKEAVIPYLDDISSSARTIGAVNTIVNRGGRLYGDNTDFIGLASMIDFMGVSLTDKKVIILGTGGTSKTAQAVAQEAGARQMLCVSRQAKEEAIGYDMLLQQHRDAEIIINTTPVGMYPKIEGSPLELTAFPQLEAVFDVVYNPLRTRLVSQAKKRGLIACGGLYMLVAQAVYASGLFLDKAINDNLVKSIYQEILREKENIVLIGMPSSGKTSIGKELAQELQRDFVDTDSEIEKRIGQSIPAYFSNFGEAAFREIEAEVCKELAKQTQLVISTGGGVIKKAENLDFFRQNGKIIFIDRQLDKLVTTADRPLSSDIQSLHRLYEERYPIYHSSADMQVDGNGNVAEVVSIIIDQLGF